MNRTPKTLIEAIGNALNENSCQSHYLSNEIRKHVKDYLSQRFSTVIFENPQLGDMLIKLFEDCTRR